MVYRAACHCLAAKLLACQMSRNAKLLYCSLAMNAKLLACQGMPSCYTVAWL